MTLLSTSLFVRLASSTLLGLGAPVTVAIAAGAQDVEPSPTIVAAEVADDRLRLRSSHGFRSTSAVVDPQGRTIVLVSGHLPSAELEDLLPPDGLIERVEFRTDQSDGLDLTRVVVSTRVAATFSFDRSEREVIVSFAALGEQPGSADLDGLASAAGSVRRTTAAVNLRSGPTTSAPRIKVVPRGSPVEVTGRAGLWVRVVAGEDPGWMHGDWIDGEESVVLPSSPEWSGPGERSALADASTDAVEELAALLEGRLSWRVNADVNARREADPRSERIAVLPVGTVVDVVGSSRGWLKVRLLREHLLGAPEADAVLVASEGYVDARYVDAVPGPSSVDVEPLVARLQSSARERERALEQELSDARLEVSRLRLELEGLRPEASGEVSGPVDEQDLADARRELARADAARRTLVDDLARLYAENDRLRAALMEAGDAQAEPAMQASAPQSDPSVSEAAVAVDGAVRAALERWRSEIVGAPGEDSSEPTGSSYSSRFVPERGLRADFLERQRHAPDGGSWSTVSLSGIELLPIDDRSALVEVVLACESATAAETTRRRQLWELENDGRWRIVREKLVGSSPN